MQEKFWSRVFEMYEPFRKKALVVLMFLLTAEVISLMHPYLFGNVFTAVTDALSNHVALKTTFREIVRLGFLMLSIRLLENYLTFARERFELKHLDFLVANHVSELTLRKILSLSIGQHRSQNSGLTMSVVSRGQSAIPQLTSLLLFNVLPLALRATIVTLALLYFRFTVGIIVVVAIAIDLAITLALNKRFHPEIKKLQDMWHRGGKMNNEIFRNLSLVQSHSQEDRVAEDYVRLQTANATFGRNMWMRFIGWTHARNVLFGITEMLVLFVAIYQLSKGNGAIGDLVFVTMLSGSALSALRPLRSFHRQYLDLASAIRKYFAIMDVEPAVVEAPNPTHVDSFKGQIEFKNVHFRYPNKPYVEVEESEDEPSTRTVNNTLHGTSFFIPAGQTVAIVGKSGAGKSTILQMLQRAYDPDSGEILIDDIDLRLLPLADYRRSLGIVEQNVALFDHTLRYNILFGLPQEEQNMDEERLLQIGKIAHLDTFYDRLSNGFDTRVGENGVQLSGGERQRVGIARALAKDPAILVFDEATSNLDALNEALIKESIAQASKGRTTIIIAHRLSTIRDVDSILVVDQGKVIMQGTHVSLLETSELYQLLVRTQMQS
jgi:ATP-binding cassette, subfamily B, heavy metal transporter